MLGPTSSTSTSKTVRFSPSRVSNERAFRRPDTITRMPRVSDSAAFSAACRHTEQLRNIDSPSRHSLLCRSNVRGVEATVKLATAAPEGVKRSSGSAVRLPTTVIGVSPAMSGLQSVSGAHGSWSGGWSGWCGRYDARLADVRTDHLGAQHRLVQRQLAVELLDGGRLGVQRHDGVDALGVLVDLVGEPATSPDVDVLDGTAVVADHVEVRVERGPDGALFEVGVEDDHHFIGTQSSLHLLRTQAATASPWQEGLRPPGAEVSAGAARWPGA